MSLLPTLEALSKDAVMTDPEDLPGLVRMLDRVQSLQGELRAGDHGSVTQAVEHCATLLEQIILRQTEDAASAFSMVQAAIEQAQNAMQSGGGAGATSVDDTEIDGDLLREWIANCDLSLSELEAQIVGMESQSDRSGSVAEIRRGIHTLKGECGVLSLHTAQKLCHEAESAIDRCVDQGGTMPVDSLLALLDWLRGYVGSLAGNPKAQAPEHDALLARFAQEGSSAVQAGNAAGAADSSADSASDPAFDDATPVTFPADMGMDENLNDFLCEAREHVTSAEEALLQLEQRLDDRELINTVFRAFHTVKGVAGFMNLTPIVTLAHNAEFLLDGARTGKIALDSRYLDLILDSCDLLTHLVGVLEGAAPPTNGRLKLVIHQLQRACEGEPPASATRRRPSAAPAAASGTNDVGFPPLGEILVGMGLASAEQVTEALHAQAEGAGRLRDVLVNAGVRDVDAAEAALTRGTHEATAMMKNLIVVLGFAAADDLEQAIDAKKTSAQRIGQLLKIKPSDLASALRAQRQGTRGPAKAQKAESGDEPAAGPAQSAPGATAAAKRSDQTVKVSTGRMDALVTMVGELVIAQQMVAQDPSICSLSDQRVQRNLTMVSKIIRDLQEVSMSLRMVTLKGTFQKMARLVRDVAGKANKHINFHTEGEDVELDRNVVDEIADPLVHMIRNSCDHGVEPADQRRAAGKPETGNVWLRAYHSGGSIVIEIEDDGRGLHREKILKKAVEKGLIPPDRNIDEIPEAEVFNMIFLPGFSTAEKVTDISGRGVGMDVVRRNIEALRGKVEIRSVPGKGATFMMRLPLTMAIIDGMVVRVGTQRYVIPTLNIQQSFRPQAKDVHTVVGKGEMAMVRGSLLPIHRLNRVLKLNEGATALTDALLLVLESNDSRCCLMVDEIIGQQQVVIKNLGQAIGSLRGVSGGAILGDGRVALILDIGGIVSEAVDAVA